jgi:hypothetical protein
MELSDLQRLHDDYSIKARCLKHPVRCAELRPQMTAVNDRLAAISDDEFRAFLAQVNRNPVSVAYVAGLFGYLKQVAAQEQTCLERGDAAMCRNLLAGDVSLFWKICREIRDHYTEGVQVQVIGYGEITTSLTLSDRVTLGADLRPQPFASGWVYKSLPKFPNADEVSRYEAAFYRYCDLLAAAGLELPGQRLTVMRPDAEGIKVYVVQRRLDSRFIGNVLIRSLDQDAALALLRRVILKTAGVFAADLMTTPTERHNTGVEASAGFVVQAPNRLKARLQWDGDILGGGSERRSASRQDTSEVLMPRAAPRRMKSHCEERLVRLRGTKQSNPTHGRDCFAQIARNDGANFSGQESPPGEPKCIRLGLDGQISNWHCPSSDPASPMPYIDTSTPLFRVDGVEQINPEIFLKNTPSFMRALIRRFFLQDVLDRYYDFRRVTIDLIANLYKEGRPDLVTPAVALVNELLAGDLAAFGLAPLTLKEIESYYREDAFIWRFFQTARRLDRFVTERILGRRYPFRLPGKIER